MSVLNCTCIHVYEGSPGSGSVCLCVLCLSVSVCVSVGVCLSNKACHWLLRKRGPLIGYFFALFHYCPDDGVCISVSVYECLSAFLSQ